MWEERLKLAKGAKFWASPIAADGKVLAVSDDGVCTVFKAGGDTAEVLAVNEMKEEVMGTPAAAGDALFIRTVSGLYCIGAKK